MKEEKALGMIEVYGRLADIEALDAALKAADTRLLHLSKVGGGLTTIFIEGEVAAVKAAVDAGGAAADKVGTLLSTHVIPRPDSSVIQMLRQDVRFITEPPAGPEDPDPEPVSKVSEVVSEESSAVKQERLSPEELASSSVAKLRQYARNTEGFPMTKAEIRYAKKDELLKAFASIE